MKKFLALVLSLCLVLSLAACGGKTADDDTGEGSKTGGTIQVGLNSAPVSMNIWCQNDLNSATIMNLVCPNLVAIDDDGNKYDYLTESSESNEDCTVWTIKLKELYWNDGTPVTSADLLFTAKYGVEHHIGFFDSYYGLVDFEKSYCPDERTVEFALTSGNVNFWKGAGNWIPVMRESEWSSVEEPTTYSYSGAGYGPYYISEWVDGEYVTLKRNPYFTQANDGAGACIDEVVFRVYTDENAMVLALQNGEVDVCANFLSASSISQLQSNSNYQIESVGSLGYTLITTCGNCRCRSVRRWWSGTPPTAISSAAVSRSARGRSGTPSAAVPAPVLWTASSAGSGPVWAGVREASAPPVSWSCCPRNWEFPRHS